MRLASVVPWAGVLAICGCSSDAPSTSKAEAPAHVEAKKPEAELTTVRLSAEAVKRLGIETVVARTDWAVATRSLGGEVSVPEGRLAHRHRTDCRDDHRGLRVATGQLASVAVRAS